MEHTFKTFQIIHINFTKVKNPPDGFCAHLIFALAIILIFRGLFLHTLYRLIKSKLNWLRVSTTDFERQIFRTRRQKQIEVNSVGRQERSLQNFTLKIELFFCTLSYILSPLLYNFSLSVVMPYHDIFHTENLIYSHQHSTLQCLSIADHLYTTQSCVFFYFSKFITKSTLLIMCLVCLASLPVLAMHISDFISNTIIGASYGTIYVSLFKYP